MKTQKLLLLAATILCSFSSFAQDLIIKKNLDTLNCKIREIGTDEVKYVLPDYASDLLFSLTKDRIDKVILAGGKEMTFEEELTNPENYLGQNKNAIKIDFLSPLTGNTSFAYERSLKPGQSLEGTLGIVGMGIDPNDVDPRGAFVKFGWKFIKSPDFYFHNMRYAHILKGAYIKPEIAFGFYSKETETYDYHNPYESSYYYSSEREDYFSMMIQLVLGKQWVINDVFLVDFYGGVGYGFDNHDGEYHYGWVVASDEVPLSFSAGLKIGILF